MAQLGKQISSKVALIYEPAVPYVGTVPRHLSVTEQLLSLLPTYFDIDADAEPMLTVSAPLGTVDVRVDGRLLEVQPSSATLLPFSCDLRDFTLGSLATRLQSAGFYASVPDTWESMAATILIDGFYPRAGAVTLEGFTSTLWRIIRPMALCFDLWADDLDKAIEQMDIRTADGQWLDWWGILYGVERKRYETDSAYRRRIVWETMAPRTNNVALEFLLKEALGYDSSVTDGAESFETWYEDWSGTYNATTWTWTTTDPNNILWGVSQPGGYPAGFVLDPVSAPSVAVNGAGTFATETYYFKYAWTNAAGETKASQHTAFATTSGDAVRVTIPALPTNATGAKIYAASSTQAFKLMGSTSGTTFDIDDPPTGGGNDADANTNTTATGVAVYTEPDYLTRLWPGSPGQFIVTIRQVVENDVLGVQAITELINRYKAAGFLFTLSLVTFYEEVFDMSVETSETYHEDVSERGEDSVGAWFIGGTMNSLLGDFPLPLVWESWCYEEWSSDGGATFTPGGDSRLSFFSFDANGDYLLGFAVPDEIVRVAPPGIILVG